MNCITRNFYSESDSLFTIRPEIKAGRPLGIQVDYSGDTC